MFSYPIGKKYEIVILLHSRNNLIVSTTSFLNLERLKEWILNLSVDYLKSSALNIPYKVKTVDLRNNERAMACLLGESLVFMTYEG